MLVHPSAEYLMLQADNRAREAAAYSPSCRMLSRVHSSLRVFHIYDLP